ncbi:MAG: hypothetical protein L6R35_001508 [Caloplaca aegaea]|nr:MAG: hypothetical protein L6R35_001508 [Caloplaca aegaea]
MVPEAAPPVTTNHQSKGVYIPRWEWPICERCSNKEHRGDCWIQCWQCHRRHRAGQCPPSKKGSRGTAAAAPVPLLPGVFLLAQNNFNIFMAPGSSASDLAQAITAAIRLASPSNRIVSTLRGSRRRGRRGRRGGRGQKSQISTPDAIAAATVAVTSTTTSQDLAAGEQAEVGDAEMRDDGAAGK